MNPLDQYPAARSFLYMVQWIANGVLSIAGVVFTANGTAIDALPRWYVLALAIAPVLWTYLGITAQANTPSYKDVVQGDAPAPDVEGERGAIDTGTAIVIAVLVLLVLIVAGVLR